MDLVDLLDNPVPKGGTVTMIDTSDGAQIRTAHWKANGHDRKGTVTILQGRTEFIEKYYEVIRELRRNGYDVVAFDWRGQGGSSRAVTAGRRGHISSMAQYGRDLEAVLRQISLAEYPGPHYAIAHSMGATVLLARADRLRTVFDRAVLSAPLTGILDYGFREKVAYAMAAIANWMGLGRLLVPGRNTEIVGEFENNSLTSDALRFARYNAVLQRAPELGTGGPTLGWLHAMGRAMVRFRSPEYGPSIHLPMLIIDAGVEKVVSKEATEDLAARMKSAGYIEIPGARHELMAEADPYREQFFAAAFAYLQRDPT